ncbi:MAG TPA: NAD(P)/FAD-dependent oxidoreductase, partial [archaeon]|nr:NAD(P)/FAD-dependent oxidoreductase [archaeon]
SLNSSKEVTVSFSKDVACTLNFSIFLKGLFNKNKKIRAIFGRSVLKPIFHNGGISKVVLSDGRKISASLFIDASGEKAVLARSLGMIPKVRELGIGIEYEFKNVCIKNKKQFCIFVGEHEVVPVGYGWVFPLRNNCARIGVATSFLSGKVSPSKRIVRYLENFLARSEISPLIRKAEKIETHGGVYPVGGMLKRLCNSNLMVVGDAASQANPLFGEGIRYGLHFGEVAGETASKILKNNVNSSNFFEAYQKECEKYVGDSFQSITELDDLPANVFWEKVIAGINYLKKNKQKMKILKLLRNELSKKELGRLFNG